MQFAKVDLTLVCFFLLQNKTGNNPQNLTAAQLKTEASLEDNPANNHPNKYVSSSWKNGEKATYTQVSFIV